MDIPSKRQKELRTWVFFFLIVLVAMGNVPPDKR
jgi:hypothetical protein